jgi:hypothetical protein
MELTQEQARKVADKVWNSFQKFRNDRINDRKVRRMEWEPDLGDLYHDVGLRYYSYEAQWASEMWTDELYSAVPTLIVRALRDEDVSRTRAQSFESLFNVLMGLWERQRRRLCSQQANDGVGIAKLSIAEPPHWPDLPDAKEFPDTDTYESAVVTYKLTKPIPFRLEAVNPLTCAWEEDEEGEPLTFVERSQRRLDPILAAYNLNHDKNSGKLAPVGPAEERSGSISDEIVTFTEICTPTTIYHIIDHPKGDKGEPGLMFTFPNPFGCVRYRLMPAQEEEGDDATWRYRPLIAGSVKVAKDKSFYASLRALAAYVEAVQIWDVLPIEGGEGGVPFTDPDTGKPKAIIVPIGKPMDYVPPPGYKVVLREARKIDLGDVQAMIEADARRYSFPDVLVGIGLGQREAAQGLTVRGEQAQHRITAAHNAQRDEFVKIARMIAHAIKTQEQIKGKVAVRTIISDLETGEEKPETRTVGPEDIEEFDMSMAMHYRSVAIKLAEREEMRRAKDDGDISRERYQTHGWGIDDTLAEDRQIGREKMQRGLDPVAMAMAIRITAKTVGDEHGIDLSDLMVAGTGETGPVTERKAQTTLRAPPTPEGQAVP